MLEESVKLIKNGECYVKNIVIFSKTPKNGKFIIRKGEKLYDRLFYITKGRFILKNKNGEELCATEGAILYLPADVVYESEWDDTQEGGYISIHFMLHHFNGEHLMLEDKVAVVAKDLNLDLYSLFLCAYEKYIDCEMFVDLEIFSIFYKILHIIFRQQERRKLKEPEETSAIYKAVLYLNDNYMSEITTEQLADMCHMSAATFRRLFKKYNNTSPLRYKNHLKLLHAKEMLKSGLYTVWQVSEIVNCADMSHFNKLYKSEFGINPSEDIPTD